MSGSIVSRNWWSTKSFCGKPLAPHQAVTARGRCGSPRPPAPSRSPWPGTWCGPIRHSGSSARPTQGFFSAHVQRLATAGNGERPVWMSSRSSAPCRWAALTYCWTRRAGCRGCSRGPGRVAVGDGDDQLVDGLDLLARLTERPSRPHQATLHRVRVGRAEDAHRPRLGRAVVGDQEPVVSEDRYPPPGSCDMGAMAGPAGSTYAGVSMPTADRWRASPTRSTASRWSATDQPASMRMTMAWRAPVSRHSLPAHRRRGARRCRQGGPARRVRPAPRRAVSAGGIAGPGSPCHCDAGAQPAVVGARRSASLPHGPTTRIAAGSTTSLGSCIAPSSRPSVFTAVRLADRRPDR